MKHIALLAVFVLTCAVFAGGIQHKKRGQKITVKGHVKIINPPRHHKH